jgi:hypothetical protein
MRVTLAGGDAASSLVLLPNASVSCPSGTPPSNCTCFEVLGSDGGSYEATSVSIDSTTGERHFGSAACDWRGLRCRHRVCLVHVAAHTDLWWRCWWGKRPAVPPRLAVEAGANHWRDALSAPNRLQGPFINTLLQIEQIATSKNRDDNDPYMPHVTAQRATDSR